jgi:hypothetical protein
MFYCHEYKLRYLLLYHLYLGIICLVLSMFENLQPLQGYIPRLYPLSALCSGK